jgi:acetyl esterase/lipase
MSLKIIRRSLPNWGWGYGPSGDGPFPAILLLHGSEGSRSGMIYRTAAILAAHGFLALPFGYSNGSNAGDIINVPLDRTAEALAALRAHELSGSRIGLYGMSRGAEHALLLASLMARDSIAGLPDAIAVHTPQTLFAEHSTQECGAILVIPDGSPGTLQTGRGLGVDRRTNCSRLRRSKSSVSTVRFF